MKNIVIAAALSCAGITAAAQNPDFHIYLCLGQSNMEGNAAVEAVDRKDVSERFKVMAAVDFNNPAREKGEWYTAVPPLVRENTGLTPMDYFGRTMVANLPENVTVGVVPVAIGGCKIEHLSKDYDPSTVVSEESWFQSFMRAYDNEPYKRMIECARLAQKYGVIKGILLHQGESNTGDQQWCNKVNKLYNDLLYDLNLKAEDVPLLAGEVVRSEMGGVCGSMNNIIAQLPATIPTAHVISSANLPQRGDGLHFVADSYRKLGTRYAAAMLSLMGIDIEIDEDDNNSDDEAAVSWYTGNGRSFGGWGGSAVFEQVTEDDKPCLKVTNPSATEHDWQVQIGIDVNLTNGKTYEMTFDVKGTPAPGITTGIQNSTDYSGKGNFTTFDVTDNWKPVKIMATVTGENANRITINLGHYVGTLYMTNVVLSPYNPASVDEVEVTPVVNHWTVYNLSGIKVLDTDNKSDLDMLTTGIYIINGKKVAIKR